MQEMNNYPSAEKLYNSLRHLGYNHMDCVKDILDNSIDANANRINISVDWDNKEKRCKKIMITDNGIGMDQPTLIDAMKLASAFEKCDRKDLGLYGMGLITASISMGRKLKVLTKCKNGKILMAYQNIDDIKDFKLNYSEANEKDISIFKEEMENLRLSKNPNGAINLSEEISESGTVVIIDDIDTFSFKTESIFIQNLKSDLGQTYRVFIKEKDINITVNNELFPAIDPIRDYKLLYPISKEIVSLESGDIELHIAEIDTSGHMESKENGVGYETRGFYILRNGREIKSAATLNSKGRYGVKIFPLHHECNNLRIEMRVPATMDKELGMLFSKNDLNISDYVREEIQKKINIYIKRCEKGNREKRKFKNIQNKDLENVINIATNIINSKNHLLDLPEINKEKRDFKGRDKDNDGVQPKKTGDHKAYKKIHKNKLRKAGDVVYGTYDGDVLGPIFKPDFDKRSGQIHIYLNTEHPKYNFLCEQDDTSDTKISILQEYYCHALSELKASDCGNDAEYNVLVKFRHNVGKELALLLKD